jgi:hypothetical protein
MSIQPERPMLMMMRELLRKMECSAGSHAPVADLKWILELRIDAHGKRTTTGYDFFQQVNET